jgi:hypothetical protein
VRQVILDTAAARFPAEVTRLAQGMVAQGDPVYGASCVAAAAFAAPPDLVDQRLEFGDRGFELGEVAGEGVLGADRFPNPVGADLAMVDGSRYPIILSAVSAFGQYS